MHRSTRSEFKQEREMLWYFGRFILCYFCAQPLIPEAFYANVSFGHRRQPPIPSLVKLCIHHIDENRENNDPTNLAPAHSSCHRSYHAKKRLETLMGEEDIDEQESDGEGEESKEGEDT